MNCVFEQQFHVVFGNNSPRTAPKDSNTLLDSQLNASHQHMRIRGSEELPVDEAGDQDETHGHSTEDQTTPSVRKENYLRMNHKSKLWQVIYHLLLWEEFGLWSSSISILVDWLSQMQPDYPGLLRDFPRCLSWSIKSKATAGTKFRTE